MKTRGRPSIKSATSDKVESTNSATPKTPLGPDSSNPPQLFLLPEGISKDARIVTLENPRYFSDDRYLVCPERGFFEFNQVAAPRTTPRSWLLSTLDSSSTGEGKETLEADSKKKDIKATGYVTKDAVIHVATPIDPMFLTLSALAPPMPSSKSSEPPRKLFLSSDDYLERLITASSHLGGLSRISSIRSRLEQRMNAVCDTVDAGDEVMYRLNDRKLLGELISKAKKMVEKGLPPSMEEKLVMKALEIPMLSIRREESSLQESINEEESNQQLPAADTPDTQTTVASTDTATSSFSEASTAATSFSENLDAPKATTVPISAPEGVAELLRLRTAFFFICSGYLAPHVAENIKNLAQSPDSGVDFAPLETHLAHLAKLRQDAVAARSLGDFSRKRSMGTEDGETRAEKRRKEDEEEKWRKANESRGVKALKKVNVTGMKKMSDFFKKK